MGLSTNSMQISAIKRIQFNRNISKSSRDTFYWSGNEDKEIEEKFLSEQSYNLKNLKNII